MLDGELCALGPTGYSDFSALRSALPGRTDELLLFVFDILWLDGEDLRGHPLEGRKARAARACLSVPSGRRATSSGG